MKGQKAGGSWVLRRRLRWIIFAAISLALVLGGVSVITAYERDMRAARDRLKAIPSQVYASKHGDIEYYLEGEGPTILVVHGVTGGIDQGMFIANAFVGPGYRYLFVSRFGYLRSSFPKSATARLQAAVYRDLLDYLHIDSVFVLGNSAGGPSSMWFAIDYPERVKGLILHSSAVPGPQLAPAPRLVMEHDWIYWSAVKLAPDALIGMLLPPNLRANLTSEQRDYIIQNVYLSVLPVSERTQGIMFDGEVSVPSVNQIPLEQIRVPTLILQSVDDPREKQGGAELARRIQGSQYVKLTGGHFLLGTEELVKSRIASFVTQYR